MLIHELLTNIYPDELRKEAANHHLIKTAQRHLVKKNYSYALALDWLGGRLCKWGHLLQERYSDTGIDSSSQTMKNCI